MSILCNPVAAEISPLRRRSHRLRVGRCHRTGEYQGAHWEPEARVWVRNGRPVFRLSPPAVEVAPDDDGTELRAVVFVPAGTAKGTARSGQEYVKPLLVLSGRGYAALSFGDLHERLCRRFAVIVRE